MSYNVTIKESSRELTKKEKIKMKDTTNAIKLDAELKICGQLVISPVDYVVLTVENTESNSGIYEQYVVVDAEGKKYTTGSKSFWESFIDIYTDMHDDDTPEPFELLIYTKESKNYKDKYFITCSLC